jgi:hypothetical protein
VKLTFEIVMLLVLAALTSSNVVSQRKSPVKKPSVLQKTPTQTPTPPRNIKAYVTQPFDRAIEKLPIQYHGHDLAKLYETLKERRGRSAKGEFETTETFRLRAQKEQSAPIIGNLTIDSLFAFESKSLEAVYDADQQVLQVAALLSGVRGSDRLLDDSRRSFNFKLVENKTEKGIYNQFFEIALVNWRTFGVFRYINKRDRDEGRAGKLENDAIVAKLEMDIPTAIKAKENMRLLVICKLVSPYSSEGDSGAFDSDYNFYYLIRNYYLNAEMLELWLYDIETGGVYEKFRPRQ